MRIRRLTAPELVTANAVYADIGFAPSTLGRDATFGAFSEDGALIGLGRLNRYDDGGLEIGGFWVAPPHRGAGLARRLVERVIAELPSGRRAHCVPFQPLLGFYRSFGMRDVPADEVHQLPESIRAKIDFCRARAADGVYGSAAGLLAFDA